MSMATVWGILTWVVLGLIAGFAASKIVDSKGQGALIDICLGIAGALLGGWIFNFTGHRGVTGLNLYSIVVSVIGAVLILVVYHTIERMAKR